MTQNTFFCWDSKVTLQSLSIKGPSYLPVKQLVRPEQRTKNLKAAKLSRVDLGKGGCVICCCEPVDLINTSPTCRSACWPYVIKHYFGRFLGMLLTQSSFSSRVFVNKSVLLDKILKLLSAKFQISLVRIHNTHRSQEHLQHIYVVQIVWAGKLAQELVVRTLLNTLLLLEHNELCA